MMMWIFASRSANDRNSQPSTIKTVLFVSLIGYYFMFVYMAEITKYFQFYNVKKCEWIFFCSSFLMTEIFHVINAFSVLVIGVEKKQQRQAKTHQTGKWKRRTKNPSTQSSIETAGQLDFAIIQNIRGGKCTCLQTVRYSHLLVQHISFFFFLSLRNATIFAVSLSLAHSLGMIRNWRFIRSVAVAVAVFFHSFYSFSLCALAPGNSCCFSNKHSKIHGEQHKEMSKTSHQAHICP